MRTFWQPKFLKHLALAFAILLSFSISTTSIYAQTNSKNLSSTKSSKSKKRRKKKRRRRKRKKRRGADYSSGKGYVEDQLRNRSKYFKFKYVVKKKDSFALILKRLAKSGIRINSRTPNVKIMKRANPHITNWDLLPPGKEIYVYIAKKDAERARVAYHFKIYDNELERRRKAFEKRFGYNAFYMASVGKYNQVDAEDDVNFSLDQNSPVSAGVLYHFPSSQYNIMYSTSFYFSLLTGITSSTGETVSPPIEFGVNYYAQFYLKKLMPYFGVDFETLSSFNTDTLLDSFKIEFDKHQILYLTGGITMTWKMFKLPFLAKLSISPSIATNTISSTDTTGKNYSGFKTMGYLNAKIHKKFFVHGMVKYHKMSDKEELSILRMGFGGGYIF